MRRFFLAAAILAILTGGISGATAETNYPVDRSYLWRSEEAYARVVPEEFLQDWQRDVVYGYDVDDIDLEISIDFGAEAVEGSGILTVTITEPGLAEIPIDITDSLTVDSVTVNGAVRPFTHTQEQVIVNLESPPEVGAQLAVRVAYHGSPPVVGNKSMRFDDHSGVPLVYTLSTPYSNSDETVIPISHYWRPCKDVPDDKSTFSLVVTVPDTMLACSNGVMASDVNNGDGTRTFIWNHDYPVAPYLIVLAATNYVTIEDVYNGPGGSADIQHFVYPDIYENALESFNITVPAIQFLATVFGEYPFIGEKYGMFASGPGPAVEEQTMVAIPAQIINGGHGYDWLLVHELAHMWWGDCVTCESWDHVWLNEGFASYSEALWEEHIPGHPGLRYYMNQMDNGPYSGSIYDPPYVWHPIVYDKGAWVLHMLRHIMGDDDFFQLLLDYRAEHEYGSVTTDDFVLAAETTYGSDLDWFFDPWIYSEGRPDYEFSWWYHGTGPYTVHLQVDQVQSPSMPTYTMPIDLRIVTEGDPGDFVIWDSLRTQQFELMVADEPTQIKLDRLDWILSDFTEIPTSVPEREMDVRRTFLAQNMPNPFDPTTSIRFSLSRAATVALRIFDVNGRLVRTLARGRLPAGDHTNIWDGNDDQGRPVSSGVYLYQLMGPDGALKKRMVLLR